MAEPWFVVRYETDSDIEGWEPFDAIGPFPSRADADKFADELPPEPADGGYVHIYLVSSETADTPAAYLKNLSDEEDDA